MWTHLKRVGAKRAVYEGMPAVDDYDLQCCDACAEKVWRFFKGGGIRYYLRWLAALGEFYPKREATIINQLSSAAKQEIAHCAKYKRALLFVPQDWQEPFWMSTAKTRLAMWGNQSGKTMLLVNMIRTWLTADYPDEWPSELALPGPTVGRLWVSDLSMMDKVFQPKFLESLDNWPENHKSNSSWEIGKTQGHISRIINIDQRSPGLGSQLDVISKQQFEKDPLTAEGWQGDYAMADEPLAEGSYDATRRGLVIRGGQFIYGGTMLDQEPWMLRRFQRNQMPGVREVFLGAMDQNAYMGEKDREEYLSSLSEREAKARRTGSPLGLDDAYFPELQDPDFLQHVYTIAHPLEIPEEWQVVSVTDWHQSKPIYTLWMAITPWDTYVFFAQLIEKVPLDTYVERMLEVERQWGVKRLKDRLVDTSINQNMDVIVDGDYIIYNPYQDFNEHLSRSETLTLRKVTGAPAAIEVARQLFRPVKLQNMDREVIPIQIWSGCQDLRETLPDYSPDTFRSGPLRGEPKEQPDKRRVRGGDSIDCFLYGVAERYTWDELERLPPAPGSMGHIFAQMRDGDGRVEPSVGRVGRG